MYDENHLAMYVRYGFDFDPWLINEQFNQKTLVLVDKKSKRLGLLIKRRKCQFLEKTADHRRKAKGGRKEVGGSKGLRRESVSKIMFGIHTIF